MPNMQPQHCILGPAVNELYLLVLAYGKLLALLVQGTARPLGQHGVPVVLRGYSYGQLGPVQEPFNLFSLGK